jgi:hypothetical protein
MNYWAPLDDSEEEKDEEKLNIAEVPSTTQQTRPKTNKWTRRMERRQEKKQEQKMILDSGATSHFVSEGLNLPKTGPSQIDVILPNNSILKSSGKTNLPLTRIVPNARVAEIIPGLTRSLISINKMAENGYTTIFHPGTEGATIHEPGTLTITTSAPPVLRGNKNNGDKLWTISTGWTKEKRPKEEVANAYSLPSIEQTIKYLHAAAGYPTKETWIKAIRMGFFITWPSLTVANVSKHHPESDETQKGHMK